jgi:hypothetical protein
MDVPPPPPGGSDDEGPASEEELFALFRHLRERVFVGSSEIVAHVMRGIEAQLDTAPRESFAATVLVQLTNWATSWLAPGDDPSDGTAEPDPETRADEDGPPPGDDDE